MEKVEYTLHRISLVNVSAYLIFRPGEAIMVDCGNKGSEVKIIEEMNRLGLRPAELRLLILTHAHFDHAGSAKRLKELTGCRIMVHHKEASRLEAGFTPIPSGTRWKARVLVTLGRTFAKGLMKYPPAIPDLLVEESASLVEFGFPGRVIHTPGHTPGSMVVFMGGGEMMAGDTLFGVPGKRIFPPFAEDRSGLLKSWKMISGLAVKHFYPAHGRSLNRAAFLNEFEVLIKSR
jgi:glyoxylase-like metal-dependent hydrolase (beta-lactamase superfamily II)